MSPFDVLCLHAAFTWAMVGVIWVVQLVQYPGFERVGEAERSDYLEHHRRRITFVVGPLMLGELVSGLALLWLRPRGMSLSALAAGLALIGVVWFWTALVAIPLHERLGRGDSDAGRALVAANRVRTAAWTLRGLWVLAALGFAAQPG